MADQLKVKDLSIWLIFLVVVECFLAVAILSIYLRINHDVRWSNVFEVVTLQDLLLSWPGLSFVALSLVFFVYWITILFRVVREV